MYEKLTPRMSEVLKLSQQIARDYEQEYVGTEHLLLALLKEGAGMGAAILNDHGADLRRVKDVVDRLIKSSMEDTWVFGRLPGTPHFRNVMATAIEEARRFQSKTICTEFLLLALSKEKGSVAYNALQEIGVDTETVMTEISRRRPKAEDSKS